MAEWLAAARPVVVPQAVVLRVDLRYLRALLPGLNRS